MSFDKALPFVLAREGGYVHHPADPGGATNKGITQAVYDSYRFEHALEKRSVKNIEDKEVEAIYRKRYWDASGAENYPWPMCLAVFDAAVNHGVSRAKEFARDADTFEAYLARRERFYNAIVANKPSSSVFLKGWMNRIQHLRDEGMV